MRLSEDQARHADAMHQLNQQRERHGMILQYLDRSIVYWDVDDTLPETDSVEDRKAQNA